MLIVFSELICINLLPDKRYSVQVKKVYSHCKSKNFPSDVFVFYSHVSSVFFTKYADLQLKSKQIYKIVHAYSVNKLNISLKQSFSFHLFRQAQNLIHFWSCMGIFNSSFMCVWQLAELNIFILLFFINY